MSVSLKSWVVNLYWRSVGLDKSQRSFFETGYFSAFFFFKLNKTVGKISAICWEVMGTVGQISAICWELLVKIWRTVGENVAKISKWGCQG